MSESAKRILTPEQSALRREIQTRAMGLDLEVKVHGDGSLNSELVIIGQGPGVHEVDQKSPMVGPSGIMLWNTLRQHGILRTDCYVTNVCKRQYSIDKRSELGRDEWTKWFSILDYELSQLPNAKIIFALGNAALDALHHYKGITDYRGSVYPLTVRDPDGTFTTKRKVDVLYSYNPANIIRNPEHEIVFQMDARTLKKLRQGDYEEWPVETRYDFNFVDALSEIARYKRENKPTAVDIELTGGQLACVGLANDLHKASCINFRTQLENLYTLEEETEILLALQDLYESLSASDNLIAQNANFDSGYSGLKDGINMPVNWDTMVMHHTLYPTLPHNLGFLTSQYTTIPYYKDEYETFKETGDVETFWQYNGKDCCATLGAWYRMIKELKDQGLYNFYVRHPKRELMHLIRMQIDGIRTDHDEREKVARQLEAEVHEARDRFWYLVNLALPPNEGENAYRPNPDSWQQLQRLFYNHLKLKDPSKSTDEDTRNKLIADPRTSVEAKEILVAVNKYKTLAKFAGTYVDLRLDEDGRFRCVWKQEGVRSAPGRLSSSQTLWGTGMNGQNQPPAAKKFFIADEGCCFFYFDLKQAEAQVVAYRADIPKWKEDFERARTTGNYDAHRALASDMFHVPYEDVPKSDRNDDDTEYTIRYTAKRCRHGLNYRMQIPRLAETANLSYSAASIAFYAYHKATPEIKAWWREQERLAKKEREIWNALGRRYKILERLDGDDALESIIAFYPQSTIGDKVRSVQYLSEEDDRWDTHKARIVLNVHDALVGVATIPFAATALSIVKAYAETPLLIENVYRTKRDQLFIGADTKMTTLDIFDKKGNVIDRDRYHRWSNMHDFHVDAAPLPLAA